MLFAPPLSIAQQNKVPITTRSSFPHALSGNPGNLHSLDSRQKHAGMTSGIRTPIYAGAYYIGSGNHFTTYRRDAEDEYRRKGD